MSKNNKWRDGDEKILKVIGEESAGYAWMNDKSEYFRKNVDNWLIFASIICFGVVSLLSAFNTQVFNDDVNINNANITNNIPNYNEYVIKNKSSNVIVQVFNILILIFSCVGGIILGCRQQFKYDELAKNNKDIAAKFQELSLLCATVLLVNRSDRRITNPREKTDELLNKFIKYVKSEKNNIMSRYENMYENMYGNKGIRIPGTIESIVINNNDDNSSNNDDKTNKINKEVTYSNMRNIFNTLPVQNLLSDTKDTKDTKDTNIDLEDNNDNININD